MRQMLPPMTAVEAMSIIEEMVFQRAPKATQRRILQLALGPVGNLSDEAREVYRMRLAQLEAA